MNFLTLSGIFERIKLINIMKSLIIKRIFTILILPVAIAALVYLNFESIAEPVRYEDTKKAREAVAIQRLKDIRTLQEAHKNVSGRYASTMDSLQLFYNEGSMTVVLQIGNHDDSIAVANTAALEKKLKAKGVKAKDMQARIFDEYNKSNHTLRVVCSVESKIPVKDTLFNERPGFCIDSLAYIPFSGDKIIMKSVISETQGIKLPLFEALVPYTSLLKGLDPQLVVNTISEKEDLDLYPGLKVGDVEKANNNAGNWE